MEDAVILVGNKPVMNYVLAAMTQIHNGMKEIRIKARGKAISKAVDVAEITKRSFISDAEIGKVEIGTEVLDTEKGKLNVSTISIPLKK